MCPGGGHVFVLLSGGGWRRVVAGVVARVGREQPRRFLVEIAGPETKARLFRAAASRATPRGHESSSGRPQSGLIGKSTPYFRVKPRQSHKKPPVPRPADGGHAMGYGLGALLVIRTGLHGRATLVDVGDAGVSAAKSCCQCGRRQKESRCLCG